MNKKTLNVLLPLFSIVTVLVLWCVSSVAVGDKLVLPSILDTLKEFIKLFGNGEFYYSLFLTVLKSLISFAVSLFLALILAIFSKKNIYVKKFFAPVVAIIRVLPTVAVVLLLLVWTNSFIAPIIVTAIVVFPTVYTSLTNDLSTVDYRQIEMCKTFNVSNKDIIFKVQIPQIMPSLLNTVGSSLSLNLKLMVAAEVLSATGNSLGNLLNSASIQVETAKMFALVLVAVIIGLIVEFIFSTLSKKAGKNL